MPKNSPLAGIEEETAIFKSNTCERATNPLKKTHLENVAFIDTKKNIVSSLTFKNGRLTDTESIEGQINDLSVNLKLRTNFWGNKAILSGKISEISIKLTLKNNHLKSNLPSNLKYLESHLMSIMEEKIQRDTKSPYNIAIEAYNFNDYKYI